MSWGASRRDHGPPTRHASAARRLMAAWITLLVVGTDLFVVSAVLPAIRESYGVPPRELGLLVSAFSLSYIVAAPLLGVVADRISRPARVLVAGLVCFALVNVATALAPTFWFLTVSRAAAGAAAAAITPTVYALTATSAPVSRVASWIAVAGSGLLSGLWAGAPAGAAVARVFGWRPVFGVLALATMVLAAVNHRTWPTPVAAATTVTPSRMDDGLLMPGVNRSHRPTIVVTTLWSTAVYLLYTYLATALAARGDQLRAPLLLACYGIGAVLGGLAGGAGADRFGAHVTTIATLAGTTAGQVAVAISFAAGSDIALGATLFFAALFSYAFFPAQQRHLVTGRADRSATLLAYNNSALYVGISLAGAAAAATERFSYPTLVAAAAAIALASVVVATAPLARAKGLKGSG